MFYLLTGCQRFSKTSKLIPQLVVTLKHLLPPLPQLTQSLVTPLYLIAHLHKQLSVVLRLSL